MELYPSQKFSKFPNLEKRARNEKEREKVDGRRVGMRIASLEK